MEINSTGSMVPVLWSMMSGISTEVPGTTSIDGAMLKGFQTINGKWYYLDQTGRMATEPGVLTPGQDGSLHYPGLAK
ncbi:MAG: hypothetical protein V8R61_10075 [Enterocloster sp.]